MIVAGVVFVATVVFTVGTDAVGMFADRVAVGKLQAAVIVRAAFCGDACFAFFAGGPADDINHAVESIAAMHSSAGATQDFDTSSLFTVDIE